MGRSATKASGNVFYLARNRAAKFNDAVASREGASDLVGIERTRLAKIELGSLVPYPEEVLLMSDIYKAPELINFYCTEMCPLGCDIPKAEFDDLDRITVRAIASMRKIQGVRERLLDIVDDGKITDDEEATFKGIVNDLEELSSITQSLKVWAKKNM